MASAMYRGTTPVFTVDFDGFTGESISKLWVNFQQGDTKLEKTYTNLSGSKLSVSLTQEETLMFTEGIGTQVQVRALLNGTKAVASPIRTVQVGAILKDGVIANED